MTLVNDPINRRQTIKRLKWAGFFASGIAVIVVATGMLVRVHAGSEQASWAVEQSIPTVAIVHPTASSGNNVLSLPGNVQAWYSAQIYARVPGYLTKWYKDIGARVHKGDVLADIDTPELDEQIDQAKADLADAQAGLKLAQITNARWQSLVAIGAVAKQDADTKEGDLAVKTAAANSAKANLDRLVATKTFAHITAPFDGIVTARATDIGALVNVGAGSGGSLLFTVADVHKVRVYVQVPQNYSAQIHGQMTAGLTLPEYPGEKFVAKLVSTSDAISSQSNTLLVELDADNADGKLKPGEFAQVSMNLPARGRTLTIPSTALLFRSDGLRVATVGAKNHVVMKGITISNDLGTAVNISAGLNASDLIIDNPPDSPANGDVVQIAAALPRTTPYTRDSLP